jgi:hypothetical protein
MRTEWILILLGILVGLIWFLFPTFVASTPVLCAIGALAGLRLLWWWKNRTPFDTEMHEEYGTLYFIIAVIVRVCWLFDPSDWRDGLIALAILALATFHFWRSRVQFSLRTILVFMTYTAVIVGLVATLRRLIK